MFNGKEGTQMGNQSVISIAAVIDYIENHIGWFLKNHPDAISEFLEEVKEKYLVKMIETGQTWIFEQYGVAL